MYDIMHHNIKSARSCCVCTCVRTAVCTCTGRDLLPLLLRIMPPQPPAAEVYRLCGGREAEMRVILPHNPFPQDGWGLRRYAGQWRSYKLPLLILLLTLERHKHICERQRSAEIWVFLPCTPFTEDQWSMALRSAWVFTHAPINVHVLPSVMKIRCVK